ncbi:UNVERIFIED_CONTAM: hypothetical protein GTU68_029434 [Idotea baltica]|nr:hypothetical protein [Idotea baltica]
MISAPDLRIVDATWFAPFNNPEQTGEEAYQAGHIPGAVFFDIDKVADPDSPYSHTLPGTVEFSSRVRKLGIGDGNRLIIYDQNGFFASARVWWMLRVMGHKDVRVLDGGFAAWQRDGGMLEDLPPVAVERHFTPRVRADIIAKTVRVQTASTEGTFTIIDARSEGRFTGQDPEPREGLSSGHIPGSVNLPGSQLTNEDGTMKSIDDLRALFEDPSAPTITSCGSGVTAAITALALARLGNWDVAVYDGSWSEWADGNTRPIATGSA